MECKQDCRLVCSRCMNPLKDIRAASVIAPRSWQTEPMSRLPAAPSPAKPAVPRSVLLADAKVTIRAPIPRVFEALLDPEQLVQWWADDPRVEAELGGRYEGTFSDGRIEGSITAIDGPGQLSFIWPIPQEGGSAETTPKRRRRFSCVGWPPITGTRSRSSRGSGLGSNA